MKEDEMLMCLIAFVLGYLVARMMRGNGLSVGAENVSNTECNISIEDWNANCDTVPSNEMFDACKSYLETANNVCLRNEDSGKCEFDPDDTLTGGDGAPFGIKTDFENYGIDKLCENQ